MANQPAHRSRAVRGVDDETWAALGAVAETQGLDRSAVIRQMIRWYLGYGELPERPWVDEEAKG